MPRLIAAALAAVLAATVASAAVASATLAIPAANGEFIFSPADAPNAPLATFSVAYFSDGISPADAPNTMLATLCKYANDGECDEPDKCAVGTDGNDCIGGDDSCKYANDGECDVPKGCAPGTDATDCAAALVGLRGAPPPTNTPTEKALKTCDAWNGQLNPNAVVNTEGNETEFVDGRKCEWYHGDGHLHFAAQLDDLESARWLLANGAEVNAKGSYGSTPLHYAAGGDAREMAELLLQNGAEVNARNERGITPLHWAAFGNARETAEVLLKNGAPVNPENNDGWTPLDEAIDSKKPEMQSLLRKHGGRCNKKC